MAWGIDHSRNFEQKQLKMAWSKNIFILDLFFTKVLELYLVKDLYQKNAVLVNFSIKK
jgi:hypothetical protein